jgi:YcaO-like protein with predicted kinase domain
MALPDASHCDPRLAFAAADSASPPNPAALERSGRGHAPSVAELPRRLQAEAERIRFHSPYTDRVCHAGTTVARMRRRFAEFGITRLAETTGLDRIGVPVWAAVRPNARTLSVCQGKGIDAQAAQASALMEAIEVATAERRDLPMRVCSAVDLARAGERCTLLDHLIRRGRRVPAGWEPIAWLEGYDLLAESTVWVPAEAATLDHSDVDGRYWRSTDGLASGNLMIEAILHGLCERVERDAGALWLLTSDRGVEARCTDPDSFEDDVMNGLVDRIARAGLHLRLFDMTSDIGVPVFFATVSPVPDGNEAHWVHFDLASGSGCHPVPLRAALRAVTEAVQSRLTVISGARDDFDPAIYARRVKPDLLVYVRATPARAAPRGRGADTNPADHIRFILQRLEAAGIGSVIAVPLRADDDEFAVAKVIVPELENPPGDRQVRFGRRGLAAMMRPQGRSCSPARVCTGASPTAASTAIRPSSAAAPPSRATSRVPSPTARASSGWSMAATRTSPPSGTRRSCSRSPKASMSRARAAWARCAPPNAPISAWSASARCSSATDPTSSPTMLRWRSFTAPRSSATCR